MSDIYLIVLFLLQVELAHEEKCEFIPFQSPKQVILKDNRIVGIEFYRTEQDDNDIWVEDTEQVTRLKADFIISAFGSGLYDLEGMFEFTCQIHSINLWTSLCSKLSCTAISSQHPPPTTPLRVALFRNSCQNSCRIS